MEVQLFPEVGVDRTARSLEKQATWNQGYCPWDISHTPLRRWLREQIGLSELIHRMIDGWWWSKYDLRAMAGLQAARARGRKGRRRLKLTAQQIEIGKSLVADPKQTV